MMIDPKYLKLIDLFERKLFTIPKYQRAYSWQKEHRKALFEDIKKSYSGEKSKVHYMATIVGLCRPKPIIITDEEYEDIEIVDGQQRITTLILLLKAIAIALDQSDLKNKPGKNIHEILVKPEDNATLLLLQTNHDSSDYFADYLRYGTHPAHNKAKTLAGRQLLLAMEECENFVDEWQESGEPLEKLVRHLKNRLTFIFHKINDEALVYTVFEVLNSRGLEISWFDRLKSMLMAIIFEDKAKNKENFINEVHNLWADIYRTLGVRLGVSAEVLRFAATLRAETLPSRLLSEKDAANLLRDQSLGKGPSKVIKTTKWIKSVTEAIDQLWEDHRRNAVTKILQARLVAAAINLRSDMEEDKKTQILRRWENVTFRIYGMYDKDARTAVGDYVRLAWKIIKENLSYDKTMEELSELGREYPIDKAIDQLGSKNDCYTYWGDELRYFFCRYEEHLSEIKGQNFNNEQWNRIWEASASDSIEHILPQSSDRRHIHWLGNLLVLPPKLNSSLGDRKLKDKVVEYTNTGLLIAQDVVGSVNQSQSRMWNQKLTLEREKKLLGWAAKEWAD